MDMAAVIKVVAPWIGTAIGGPLGGMALEAAAAALGASDKTLKGVQQALSGATTAELMTLKQADAGFALKMQELGFQNAEAMEALAAGDRKDARDLLKSTKSPIPAVLSLVVTVGFFGLLAAMMFGSLKDNNSQALLLMLGSLATGWGMVMTFWFGSTHESGRKTELISQADAVKPL